MPSWNLARGQWNYELTSQYLEGQRKLITVTYRKNCAVEIFTYARGEKTSTDTSSFLFLCFWPRWFE